MSAPDNAPPACPRRLDSSSGPRRCACFECPQHLLRRGERGPLAASRRLRIVAQLDDTCAVDLSERAHVASDGAPIAMSFDELAVFLACSRPTAIRLFRRAWRKFRKRMKKGYVASGA